MKEAPIILANPVQKRLQTNPNWMSQPELTKKRNHQEGRLLIKKICTRCACAVGHALCNQNSLSSVRKIVESNAGKLLIEDA
jgi:hypothetical protein